MSTDEYYILNFLLKYHLGKMFAHSGIKIIANVNHCQVYVNTSNLDIGYIECTYPHRYEMSRKKYVCAISFLTKAFEILSTCIKIRDRNYFFVL